MRARLLDFLKKHALPIRGVGFGISRLNETNNDDDNEVIKGAVKDISIFAGGLAGKSIGGAIAGALSLSPWGTFLLVTAGGLIGSEGVDKSIDSLESFFNPKSSDADKIDFSKINFQRLLFANLPLLDQFKFDPDAAWLTLTPEQKVSLTHFDRDFSHIVQEIEKLRRDAQTDRAEQGDIQSALTQKIADARAIFEKYKQEIGTVELDAKQFSDAMHQDFLDKSQFTHRIVDTSKTILGAAKILHLFGNSEIANELATVGLSTLHAIEQGGALLGMGLGAATVNPVFAVASIAEALTNIVGLFRRKKKLDDSNQVIFKAIAQLFDLVKQLRNEMHEQFNEIKSQLDHQTWIFVEKFELMQQTQQDHNQLLIAVHQDMQKGFAAQEARLSGIAKQLLSLNQQLSATAYRQDIEALQLKLRHIIQNTAFSDFNALSTEIDHIALENNIHHQLSSLLNLPEEATGAAFFQATSIVTADALQQSPIALLYATIANILLILKKYPTPDAQYESQRLSKKDFDRLVMYQKYLNHTAQMILTARKPAFFNASRITRYQNDLTALADALDTHRDEFEKQYTKQQQLSRMVLLNDATQWEMFNADIPVETGRWFTGDRRLEKRWYCRSCGKRGQWFWPEATRYDYLDTNGKQAYIDGQLLRQRNNKTAFRLATTARKTAMLANPNVLRIFSASELNTFHEGLFFIPDVSTLPYLPISDPLFTTNQAGLEALRDFKTAQLLGLGSIHFSYQLVEAQNSIQFQIRFILNGKTEHPTIHIDLPYIKMPYSTAESVWNNYMGGMIHADFTGVSKTWREGITGEEALNGHGHGHKRGEFETNHYAALYPPESTFVLGAHAQFDEPLTLQIQHLDQLHELLREANNTLKRHYQQALVLALDITKNDVLGVAAAQLETQYRLIKGFFTLAFFDDMQNPQSEISQLFSQYLLNLKKIKLLPSAINPSDALRRAAIAFPEFIEKIALLLPSTLNFKLLESIKEILTDVISLYQSHIVLNNADNPLVDQAEQVIQFQTKLLVLTSKFFSSPPTEISHIQAEIQALYQNTPSIIVEEAAHRIQDEMRRQKQLPNADGDQRSSFLPGVHAAQLPEIWQCHEINNNTAICIDKPFYAQRMRILKRLNANESWVQLHGDQNYLCEKNRGYLHCVGNQTTYDEYSVTHNLSENLLLSAKFGFFSTVVPEIIGDSLCITRCVNPSNVKIIKNALHFFMMGLLFLYSEMSMMELSMTIVVGMVFANVIQTAVRLAGFSEKTATIAGNTAAFLISHRKQFNTLDGFVCSATHMLAGQAGLLVEKKMIGLLQKH